jgi:hypothetical protein
MAFFSWVGLLWFAKKSIRESATFGFAGSDTGSLAGLEEERVVGQAGSGIRAGLVH